MDSPINVEIPSILRSSLINDKEQNNQQSHDLNKWLKYDHQLLYYRCSQSSNSYDSETKKLREKVKMHNLQNLKELLNELNETSWMFDI